MSKSRMLVLGLACKPNLSDERVSHSVELVGHCSGWVLKWTTRIHVSQF